MLLLVSVRLLLLLLLMAMMRMAPSMLMALMALRPSSVMVPGRGVRRGRDVRRFVGGGLMRPVLEVVGGRTTRVGSRVPAFRVF